MQPQIVYVVAGLPLQPYAPGARLCLVGADHKSFPRTYASPQAIQRTELLEWALLTGSPNLVLYDFKPYQVCERW